jgi:tetratricopeptide (TPR) repeat protein
MMDRVHLDGRCSQSWLRSLARLASIGVVSLTLTAPILAQGNPPAAAPPPPNLGKPAPPPDDLPMVERLLTARKDYQSSLERLRAHYKEVGDVPRMKWAEEELLQYHRIAKQAYRLDLDVPPPTLQAQYNIKEATELFKRAMTYKDKGWNTDYIDNQRRAELLFQQLLQNYPQSSLIDDTAYELGDIYESKAYKQYKRAALYFERCFQWNPGTEKDARLRAARLYDKQLNESQKASQIYSEVLTTEHDPKRTEEAKKRLTEMGGGK